MGVNASVDKQERRPPSASADRKARMFYAAARQYTALQKIPLRSPYRLLDATRGHRAFLFAKQQGLEIPFMMSVRLRGLKWLASLNSNRKNNSEVRSKRWVPTSSRALLPTMGQASASLNSAWKLRRERLCGRASLCLLRP